MLRNPPRPASMVRLAYLQLEEAEMGKLGELQLPWANAVPYEGCQVITLWWQEVKLAEPEDIGKAQKLANAANLPQTGLYAFEGFRDGSPGRTILYVGQSGSSSDEEGPPAQSLSARLAQSFKKFNYKTQGKSYFFSDVWDLTVRFAHLDFNCIPGVEAVLIHAHAPPFNRQHVRGALPSSDNYLVLNAGRKGALLPVVASVYYRSDCWPDPPQTNTD